MKVEKNLSVFVIIFVLSLVFSCDLLGIQNNDGNDEKKVYADNVVLVEGTITQNTLWSEGKVYVVLSNVSVEGPITLTLAAGAIVKLGTNGILNVSDGASIKSNGRAEKPVIFTSILDSSAGGVSILNGSAAAPSRGDWNYVWIQSNATNSSLTHTIFRYGGRYKNSTVYAEGPSHFNYCTFYNNLNGRPYVSGEYACLDMQKTSSTSVLTNCLFYQNTWPLAIPSWMNIGDTNQFSFDHDGNVETAALVNTYQAIYVDNDEISTAVTWKETEICFCINDLLEVTASGSLICQGDVAVKFLPSARLYFNEGATRDLRTAIFTSYKDDTVKGDTNADGNLSSPSDGDWNGIYDYNLNAGDGDYLARNNNGQVRYSECTTGD